MIWQSVDEDGNEHELFDDQNMVVATVRKSDDLWEWVVLLGRVETMHDHGFSLTEGTAKFAVEKRLKSIQSLADQD